MELMPSPVNLLGEIAKTVEQFGLPGLDAGALLEGRRKDIEAIAEANRIALSGMQELARKQGEILQATLRELQELVQEARTGLAQDPPKFGDLVQKSLQKTFCNMRDLAELARKSQAEAFRVVGERMQRNIEELRSPFQPPKATRTGKGAQSD
jgi:phasin family protein